MTSLIKPRNARTMAQVGSYKTTIKECRPDPIKFGWNIIKVECQGFAVQGSFPETYDVGQPVMVRVAHKTFLVNHTEAIIEHIKPLQLLPEDPVLHRGKTDPKKSGMDH